MVGLMLNQQWLTEGLDDPARMLFVVLPAAVFLGDSAGSCRTSTHRSPQLRPSRLRYSRRRRMPAASVAVDGASTMIVNRGMVLWRYAVRTFRSLGPLIVRPARRCDGH